MQVPLGIQLRSEQKYEEMADIIRFLHKYVPRDPTTTTVSVPGCSTPMTLTKSNFFKIGLGIYNNYNCS